MAVLSKHGAELLRRHEPECEISHRADGNILINRGDGWKLWKKVKPGVDPVLHAQAIKARPVKPHRKALTDWMVANVPLKHRWRVLQAVQIMPDDSDGVWSTLDDYRDLCGLLSIDDCVEVCRLYRYAKREQDLAREAKLAEKGELV